MPNNARHILIVDDEQDIRRLLKARLEGKGYVCHTADSAEAAIEVLNAEPVDLMLIDIIMPDMTGLTLFKYIRELFPDTAIIFVTSVDDMNVAFDCVKEGAYDYIVKDKIPYRLVQAVGQALERRDASREIDRHLSHLEELVDNQAVALRQKFQEIAALNQLFRDKIEVHPEEATELDLDRELLNVLQGSPWLTEPDADAGSQEHA